MEIYVYERGIVMPDCFIREVTIDWSKIGRACYLRDIPALDFHRPLLLEIDRLAKSGAQFLIASHSPILLGLPDAQILSFDDGMIHPCEYLDTESYRVTEMFINNREYFLKRLLS